MQTLLVCVVIINLILQFAQPLATSYEYHRVGEIMPQYQDHHRPSHFRPFHSIRHQQHFEVDETEGPEELSTAVDSTESSNILHHLHHQHQSRHKHSKSKMLPELENRLHFNHNIHNQHQRYKHKALPTQRDHTRMLHETFPKWRTVSTADKNSINGTESETAAGAMGLIDLTPHPTYVTTKSANTSTLNEVNKSTQNYYHQKITRQQLKQQLYHNHHKMQPKSDSSEMKRTATSANEIQLNLHAKSEHVGYNEEVYEESHYSSNEDTDDNATASVKGHSQSVDTSTESIISITLKSDSSPMPIETSSEKESEYGVDDADYYYYNSYDESNTGQDVYEHTLAPVDIGYEYDNGADGNDAEWHIDTVNDLGTAYQHSRHYQEQPLPQIRLQQRQQPKKYQGEYSRVARDHQRVQSHPFSNNHLTFDTNTNDDYSDDEPYRQSSEQYSSRPGDLTNQKYRELGTRQAVQQSRDIYMQRHKSPADLAYDHINRMKVAARCSRPVPRVFHVSNTTSETFVPSCTILHRCGEDTGCCRSMGQVCTVNLYEEVPLHFIVIQVNSSNSRPQIKILRLRNDTECHCVNRTELTSAPEFFTRDKRSGFAFIRRGPLPLETLDQQSQLEDRSDLEENNEDYVDAVCRCPRHFRLFQDNIRWQPVQQRPDINSRHAHTLNCRCDCADINTPCQRFKNGEEGFAVDDRRCIADRVCSVPTCSFGIYNEEIGRCPRPNRTQKRYNNGFG